MNPKELKKLADTCRKAGIKHFKNADYEFTLADDAPVSNYKKRNAPQLTGPVVDPGLSTQQLTDEEMLFWSVGGAAESTEQ
jgi:hypothetical protein